MKIVKVSKKKLRGLFKKFSTDVFGDSLINEEVFLALIELILIDINHTIKMEKIMEEAYDFEGAVDQSPDSSSS